MTMTAADWLIRFAKLNWLVNVSGLQGGEDHDEHDQAEDAGSDPTSPPADLGDVGADDVAEADRRDSSGASGSPSGVRSGVGWVWRRHWSSVHLRGVLGAAGPGRRSGRW